MFVEISNWWSENTACVWIHTLKRKHEIYILNATKRKILQVFSVFEYELRRIARRNVKLLKFDPDIYSLKHSTTRVVLIWSVLSDSLPLFLGFFFSFSFGLWFLHSFLSVDKTWLREWASSLVCELREAPGFTFERLLCRVWSRASPSWQSDWHQGNR